MPSSYSYLDVAVLDPVRLRFAAGDALVILPLDLGRVLWANGPGAVLFGYSDIDAIMAAEAVLPPVARRQLAATSGFPDIGRDRAVMLRLASGMASHAAGLLASAVVMPDGEKAILLAVPAAGADPSESARRAIAGFTQEGEFFAVLDGKGAVEAASEGFGALGISGETLAALVEDVAGEVDRLVKRRIAAGAGSYPAGLARLADEPARHLLVVVDDGGSAETEPEMAAAEAGQGEAGPQSPAPVADKLPPPVGADRNVAPVRFVWRTDAEGAFSTISPEFAAVVGERASDIVGRRFGAVAATFGLDPSGEIAQLLERRDTWSGRTLQWPTESGFRVPVDLAALPVYSRDRVFEGFRGFGVARPADAVSDPGAAVLFAEPEEQPAVAPQEEEAPKAAGETLLPADPFGGEVPALTIAPQPDRRFTDKVIRLAEHRPASVEKGLSSVERSAFREIGARLKKDSAPAGQEADAAESAPSGEPVVEPAGADLLSPATEPGQLASGEVRAEPPPARPGSLLKYAATDIDAGSDDNMAAVDFADARDDETLPSASEMQGQGSEAAGADDVPAREQSEAPPSVQEPAEQDEAKAAGRSTAAPPLRTKSVVPSAFATAQDRTPDTSILAKLPVPLLIHSGDTLHYANDEFLDLTGYGTLEDLTEAGGLEALFADPYADDSAADRTGRCLRLRVRDGGELSVDALLRAVPWRGGKALMLVLRRTAAGDSHERDAPVPRSLPGEPVQPDTAELKARIAEMRTIIDTATDGVVLIGRDGAIRSISRPAEALFGFDSDEVAGKSFASLFAIESQRAASDYLASLSEPGVASVLNDGREVIGREAQGRFIPLFMTVGRLPGDSGYCAVVRDITQWKRAEEDLTQARAVAERASSQKTDFLARISHEIRTPLNAIIGFSELMVDEKFGPVANDRYRDYLRDINRSGNHVLDLVNDLLDISKIEAGQQEMDYEAVSLNDTLAETVAMMQPQANRERVIIRSSLASRLPEVVADLRSVRQIALNILSNAIRYTQAGGQVIVSTAYEPSGDVMMRVRDTGVGMTQAEIEQALKPFKQLNALKRGRGDGTGLGLPLTKAMVEANRARFAIHSTPGEGTLVEIAFPSTRVLAE